MILVIKAKEYLNKKVLGSEKKFSKEFQMILRRKTINQGSKFEGKQQIIIVTIKDLSFKCICF